MKLQDKTITVDTVFGDKTVNRDQFVKRWLEHAQEVKLIIDYNNDHYYEQMEKFLKFEKFVKELAKKHFEKVYTRQNKQETVY
jgi:hypothetical protein